MAKEHGRLGRKGLFCSLCFANMNRFLFLLLCVSNVYAADKSITMEFRNIRESSGQLFIAIYNSEGSYKEEKPFKRLVVESNRKILRMPENLPEGSYVFSAFQDINGNRKLDKNLIGIPREPIGIGNYNGKGIPGGFDKLKIPIFENGLTVVVELVKIF